MEENPDNDDYNREDIEHVESMLYANIHYNSGCTEPSANQGNGNQAVCSSSINSKSTDSERKASAPRKSAKRYWNNATPNFKPFFKEKQSGIYKSAKIVPGESRNMTSDDRQNTKNDQPVETSETTTPKQFTPYVSFLPFNDSGSNAADEPIPTVPKSDTNTKAQKTNNDLVRTSLSTKHINPFSKKHVIDTYKSLFNNEINNDVSPVENKKRLNPFHPSTRKAKKKKTNASPSKSVRKSREELKQLAKATTSTASTSAVNTSVIDVESDDNDDVIILPTQEPPLICVDSSDDETSPKNMNEHEFTEPNAVSDARRRAPRCTSPSSSIQSADDFIVQSDNNGFGFDTFGTLSDDDLCHVGEAVESDLRNKGNQTPSSKSTIRNANDNAIFTPPKQMQKEKNKSSAANAKRSYEVDANSFTAVDVYESESSDMPDSIYAKGGARKRKTLSDSDSSEENISIVKSKRLKKRKSSLSAKESDHMHSDGSSSDLPEDNDVDNDDDDDDDEEANENSHIVRGEALGKVKNANGKKSKKSRNTNEKRSEDDFMNKLSNIVYGESDDNVDDESIETSPESVRARDIVESVLKRRTKRSKKDPPPQVELSNEINAPNSTTESWAITDEVGETDELNLGAIMDENTEEGDGTQNKDNSSQENPQNESTTTKEPTIQSQNQSNENQQNQSNQEQELEPPCDNEVEKEDELGEEISWNEEMKRFYNNSWGGESFSVKNIRARMPKGFLNWMIINKDKFPSNDRGRQIRCLNCQDKGHRAKNCPRPPAKKRCYMCGIEGHLEPKCPNKICLICGRKSQKYSHGCGECSRERDLVCYICRRKGHRQTFCPDRWRRYHSTVNVDQPLVQEPTNIPNKPKYCCLCSHRGHLAEQCRLANRVPGPLGVHVSSYRPILSVPETSESNTASKYTVLTSSLNGYGFNFGQDVPTTGNTIYARFRRAVNIENSSLNLNQTSDSDVMILNESDRPIEVYDDYDFDADFDNESSFEIVSAESSHDNSVMSLNNTDADLSAAADSNDFEIVSTRASNARLQINQLDDKMQTLNELKDKMILHQPNVSMDDSFQSTDQDQTESTDTSAHEQKDLVTTSTALPDFIPLNSEEPEKYEPTRSPSPVSADSTTNANEIKSDATIHLTEQHCKYLLNEKGNRFLRTSEENFGISVRLEWRDFGNVLIVNGIPTAQRDFHSDLKYYFQSNERTQQSLSVCNSLPKNREALISFVRDKVTQLDSPFCNSKHLADVPGLFHRIQSFQENPSKGNINKVNRLRQHLNMILFGRYGFAEGKTHLNALQEYMRRFVNSNQTNIALECRKQMAAHIDYIFSGIDHENYESMIEHYIQLRKDKCLPALSLDRKLMGLKINVFSDPTDESSENSSKSNNSYKNTPTSFNKNSTPRLTSNNDMQNNGRTNSIPSLLDIQINVSKPSTSYQNHETPDTNESFHRNSFPQSSKRRMSMDKWRRMRRI